MQPCITSMYLALRIPHASDVVITVCFTFILLCVAVWDAYSVWLWLSCFVFLLSIYRSYCSSSVKSSLAVSLSLSLGGVKELPLSLLLAEGRSQDCVVTQPPSTYIYMCVCKCLWVCVCLVLSVSSRKMQEERQDVLCPLLRHTHN